MKNTKTAAPKAKATTENKQKIADAVEALGDQPSRSTIRAALGKDPLTPNAGRHPKSGKAPEFITIHSAPLEEIRVPVVGDSETSLIVHNWGPKAVFELLGKHMGIEKDRLRQPKNPFEDFLGTLYKDRMTGEMQIRTIMFKNAMIEACRLVDGVKPNDVKQAVQIVGEFAPLYGQPTNRLDAVKVGMFPDITTDLRFRAEFREWIAMLGFRFDPSRISKEAVINLLDKAGTNVGIGDWRPMKGGVSGTFSVWRGTPAEATAEMKRMRRWRLSELTPLNTRTDEILGEVGLDAASVAELLAPPKPEIRPASKKPNGAGTAPAGDLA